MVSFLSSTCPALPVGLLSSRGFFTAAQAQVTSEKSGLDGENALFCLMVLGSQISRTI